MKNLKFTIILLTFCLTTYYCTGQVSSKEMIEKELTVDQFQRVNIDGGGNVFFHYSPSSKVIIRTKQSCLVDFKANVFENVLGIKSNNSGDCRAEIHIYTLNIEGVDFNGGGEVSIEKGFPIIPQFRARTSGGGELRITNLIVDTLTAETSGGGRIYCTVKNLLKVRTRGGGEIFYYGNPQVESSFIGGGSVERITE